MYIAIPKVLDVSVSARSFPLRAPLRAISTATLLAAAIALPATSADQSWTGIVSNVWDDQIGTLIPVTNWSPFGVAGAGDNVFFKTDALNKNVLLNGNRTVSSVTIDSLDDYLLTGFSSSLSIQTGNVTADGGDHGFNIPIHLLAPTATWDIGYGTSLRASGINSSSSTSPIFTKNGIGELVFSGPSNQSATIVNRGRLEISFDHSLGVPGADVTLGSGATLSITDGDFGIGRTLTLLAGDPANIEVRNLANFNPVWHGPIVGAGGINKTGVGKLSITNTTSNTNTGRSMVSQGILSLETPAGVAAVGGDLLVTNLVTNSSTSQLIFNADYQTTGTSDLTATNQGFVDFNGTKQRFNKVTASTPSRLSLYNTTLHADTFESTSGKFTLRGSGPGSRISTSRVIGSMFIESATFSPGDGIGSAIIEGDFEITSSTLAIALAGTTPGFEHDKLIVQGTINAIGFSNRPVLNIQLVNGFTPSAGDTFDILDFTSFVNTFGTIKLPTLDADLSWDTSSLYTTGEISVVPEPSSLAVLALGAMLLTRRRRR